VQVFNSIDAWDILAVTTSVTGWVGGVHFGLSVEWLVDVTNVMDNQAESEGKLVSWVWEGFSNLLVVSGAGVVSSVGEHANESVHGIDKVDGVFLEGVVRW
jgi:hypothetical protein